MANPTHEAIQAARSHLPMKKGLRASGIFEKMNPIEAYRARNARIGIVGLRVLHKNIMPYTKS
jgi:hypothetical protein